MDGLGTRFELPFMQYRTEGWQEINTNHVEGSNLHLLMHYP
jgi:hypothetical protein